MTDITPTQAASDAAIHEKHNADINAAEASIKAQRLLLEEAVERGAKIYEGRIIALEKWQEEHSKKIDNLATKDDIKELLTVFENFKLAASIVSIGGRWGYKTLLVIAGIVGAMMVISGGLKAAILTLIAWVTFK